MEKWVWSIRGGIGCVGEEKKRRRKLKRWEQDAITDIIGVIMTLGFTESKVDSNLCFKVEGRRLVMLLLYVNDLFLTEKRNSLSCKKETCC